MKKFFVILVALLIITIAKSFGQLMLSNGQVYRTIYSSDNLNNLKNQDLIHPGDTLHYLLFGALPISPIVKKGDCQAKMLSSVVFSEVDLKNALVVKDMMNPAYVLWHPELQQKPCPPYEEKSTVTMHALGLIIMFALAIILTVTSPFRRSKK